MGSGIAPANVLHVLHMEVVSWPGNGTWQENRGKPVATLTKEDRMMVVEQTRCRGCPFTAALA
jgi:hypothetical protein